MVPCDLDPDDCAFTPSPGDTGPEGCGLHPCNELALEVHHRIQSLGADAAFNLTQLEFENEDEAELFAEKLMLLATRVPQVTNAIQKRREEHEQIKSEKTLKRRQSPRKA